MIQINVPRVKMQMTWTYAESANITWVRGKKKTMLLKAMWTKLKLQDRGDLDVSQLYNCIKLNIIYLNNNYIYHTPCPSN